MSNITIEDLSWSNSSWVFSDNKRKARFERDTIGSLLLDKVNGDPLQLSALAFLRFYTPDEIKNISVPIPSSKIVQYYSPPEWFCLNQEVRNFVRNWVATEATPNVKEIVFNKLKIILAARAKADLRLPAPKIPEICYTLYLFSPQLIMDVYEEAFVLYKSGSLSVSHFSAYCAALSEYARADLLATKHKQYYSLFSGLKSPRIRGIPSLKNCGGVMILR